jgi:hypothetical protein
MEERPMARVNPDPYKEGYVFTHANRVTAFFDSMDQARRAEEALREAGVAEQAVDLFVGEEGVRNFDATGERHGWLRRLYHRLERFLGDEFDLEEHADRELRQGHVLLAALTGGEEGSKRQVGQVLRRHGGHEVYYWGRWTTERLA